MLVRQSAARKEVTVLLRFISGVSNGGTGREDDKVLSLTYRGLNDNQCISCIIHSDMPRQERFQSTQNAMSVDSGVANRLKEAQVVVERLTGLKGREKVMSHRCQEHFEHTCRLHTGNSKTFQDNQHSKSGDSCTGGAVL